MVTGMTPIGKDGFSDQAVQERTFPGFELPQHRHIDKLIPREKTLAGFDLAIQREDVKLITDFPNSAQEMLGEVLNRR